jgi:hypothetical protein
VSARNKYIFLVLTLLVISAAGLWSAERSAPCCYETSIHPDHGSRYTDAAMVHRFHQNHVSRYRFHLDGCTPVQQDTMLPIVIGAYTIAPVQHLFFTPAPRPTLRGPPVVA